MRVCEPADICQQVMCLEMIADELARDEAREPTGNGVPKLNHRIPNVGE